MKEENKISIKLTIVIIAIVLIIAIIGIGAIVVLNENEDNILGKNNNATLTQNNNSTLAENPNTVVNNENDTDISFKFLKMEKQKENMVYSPLSIRYALNMLRDGANGNTKAQIENVIGKDMDLTKYDNIDDILSLVNALYIRDTYSQYVKDEYKTNLMNQYNAEIKYDAFSNAKNINSWIENKTFSQIKNMLLDNQVANPDNEMILINALAIDMEWEDKFNSENTHASKFYLDNGNTVEATTMNKETHSENISYYKDSNVTAISMDLEEYNNEQMDFIAIMPNSNLSNYVENFSTDELNKIINNLTPASKTPYGLDISIPRFSFDYKLNLNDDLKKLGITDAFDANLADFSNMSNITEERNLFVSDALHKANIDFTENGVKAAAVTVILMKDSAAFIEEHQPEKVSIDKPFIYVIRDKKTNEIWFVGTVYEPNLWENDKTDYQYR